MRKYSQDMHQLFLIAITLNKMFRQHLKTFSNKTLVTILELSMIKSVTSTVFLSMVLLDNPVADCNGFLNGFFFFLFNVQSW